MSGSIGADPDLAYCSTQNKNFQNTYSRFADEHGKRPACMQIFRDFLFCNRKRQKVEPRSYSNWIFSTLFVTLSSCILASESQLATSNRPSPVVPTSFESLSARACFGLLTKIPAAIASEVIIDDTLPNASLLLPNGEQRVLSMEKDGDAISYTVPLDLFPGLYPLTLTRADGVKNSNISNLIVTVEDPVCVDAYRPLVSALVSVDAIVLDWPVSALNATFKVQRRQDDADFETIATSLETPSFRDTAASLGTRYTYKVTAVTAYGDFESAPFEILTPPHAPTSLQAESSVGKVQLMWSAAASANGYDVERALDDAPSVFIGTTDKVIFEDTSAPPGIPAAYRVFARNVSGRGPASARVVAALQSSRAVYVCAYFSHYSSGLFISDATFQQSAVPTKSYVFEPTRLTRPPTGIASASDAEIALFDGSRLVIYALSQMKLKVMLTMDVAPGFRDEKYAGKLLAYDPLLDEWLIAGKGKGAETINTIFTIPRGALSYGRVSRERTKSLIGDIAGVAIDPIHRELFLSDRATNKIFTLDLDDLDAGIKRSIEGSATRLSEPAQLSYDATRDEIVVVDYDGISRFDRSSMGNVPPKWFRAEAVTSIAVDVHGNIYASNDKYIERYGDSQANALPTGSINLPIDLQPSLATVLDKNAVILAGARDQVPFVGAWPLVWEPTPSPDILFITQFDSQHFGAPCAFDPGKKNLLVKSPQSSNFTLTFFDTTNGLSDSLRRFSDFGKIQELTGTPTATNFSTFARRPDTGDVLVAGTITIGQNYDFVATYDDDASGPSVTPLRGFYTGSQSTASTPMVLVVDPPEYLWWTERDRTLTIVNLDQHKQPAAQDPPAFSKYEILPPGEKCVGLAQSRSRGRLYILTPTSIRTFRRHWWVEDLGTLNLHLGTAVARGLTINDAADELVVHTSEAILVFSRDAVGDAKPLRTLPLPASLKNEWLSSPVILPQ